MKMMAIDPGDVHCGWALFEDGQCYKVGTFIPEDLLNMVTDMLADGDIDVLVVEEYRLYPDKAKTQSYSDFPTVETIGALKYLARTRGILIVMQPAAAKRPATGFASAMKIPMLSYQKGQSRHAKDAELHGIYWTQCERKRGYQ